MTPAVPRCVFLIHFLLASTPLSLMIGHVSTRTSLTRPNLVTWALLMLTLAPLTCRPSLPRHQPEPYIRRCVANAPLPRHICTFAAHLFSFSCLVQPLWHSSRTSYAPLCALSTLRLRTSVQHLIYIHPLYDLVVRVPYLVHHAARQGITGS